MGSRDRFAGGENGDCGRRIAIPNFCLQAADRAACKTAYSGLPQEFVPPTMTPLMREGMNCCKARRTLPHDEINVRRLAGARNACNMAWRSSRSWIAAR